MEFLILLVRSRSEAVLEAVGRHYVHRTEELGAFLGRNFAHGGEYIGILGRFLLQGIDGRHIEAASHLLAVVLRDIVIERQVVAGQAAAHHGGMGGKDRSHGKRGSLQVQDTGPGLPLMELRHHLLSSLEVVVVEALYHPSRGNAEHGGFFVIPIARDGIHAVHLPHFSQDFVCMRKEGLVIYQDGQRLSGDVPASNPETESLGLGLGLPRAVQHGVFQEIRISGTVHPNIRADKNMPAAHLLLQMEGLGGHYGIDTAHLVANLPADFEEIIRTQ